MSEHKTWQWRVKNSTRAKVWLRDGLSFDLEEADEASVLCDLLNDLEYRIKELEEAPLNLPSAVETKRRLEAGKADLAAAKALLAELRQALELVNYNDPDDPEGYCWCSRQWHEMTQEHSPPCLIARAALSEEAVESPPFAAPRGHAGNVLELRGEA